MTIYLTMQSYKFLPNECLVVTLILFKYLKQKSTEELEPTQPLPSNSTDTSDPLAHPVPGSLDNQRSTNLLFHSAPLSPLEDHPHTTQLGT